jgi:two-component system sensor kinase FixL
MKIKKKAKRKASVATRDGGLRALLADIVQSSDDAIFSRKLDGTISSWNTAAARIFGYHAEEIIGKPSSWLLPPGRLDEANSLLTQIRRGNRVEHFETVRLRKGGQPLTVSLTLSPIRGPAGRITGASTIARDVTAQRELETQLLESSERERRRFGRDLHDGLGQQLAGMELFCRALVRSLGRRAPAEARTAELLVTQIQSATRQIRALARGLTPVMESPNGLMLALEDFATSNRTLFRLNCSFACEEPVLIPEHAAALHLFRIAQEAVTNAIRHGRARRVEITLYRKLKQVSLEIRDHGRGFTVLPPSGAGIGLRIMKYRASVLRGALRFANVVPRGAIVTCTVPAAQLETKISLTR